ncbi:MAG: arginine--tRNA ligase [Lachnospiraceae bacterium]|nr:arginine--tRNA ligase [Lachnospiraceae bacterium]
MKQQLAILISQNIEGVTAEDILPLLETPPKPELGDYAFPCFRFAKTLHKSPNLIAEELADTIRKASDSSNPENTAPDSPSFIEEIKVQGAYCNFYIKKDYYVQTMLEEAAKENFGGSEIGKGQAICIDYSSPNVAKNFHVGHLRTTIIGNSLYKIYSKLGYQVNRINHLGDWGTQFGKLIVAYKTWGSKEAVEERGIAELMDLYVKFHAEAEKDESLIDQARAWFVKMEQGDEEALSIWQWFKDISMVEYRRVYNLLNVDFDSFAGESFYRDKTQAIVDRLEDAKLLTESDGAYIVDLSDYDMAPCIIKKADGGSIYATRDLAAIYYRKETYHFVKCLYVTGQEQKLHFRQVFKVIELLGNDWAADQLIHIPYGLVSLEGAKLSTRSGNIIYAEDILLEAISKVKEIIAEKNPNLENKEEAARIVGVGAIMFHDLYNQRIKDVSFKWENVLNFDGETGPYVQYTHARCCSLLRAVPDFSEDAAIDYSVLTDPDSLALLKSISKFPKAVQDAADKYEPFLISRFAIEVAQSFNRFYNSNRINVEDTTVRNARLKLTAVTKNTLREALALLGIGAPEQM